MINNQTNTRIYEIQLNNVVTMKNRLEMLKNRIQMKVKMRPHKVLDFCIFLDDIDQFQQYGSIYFI